ncbi:MAG: PAS domain S-box protein [Kastovskya adunca ATA6-11-RM4]|jgi:PAS domain S-box-containing protein|nr:PAS domain S-box protein [Kastovskya adunca ATA6-11-RM4]
MNKLFEKLLSSGSLEYFTLDRQLTILETSPRVSQFADHPQEVLPGRDARLGFPELVGSEEILTAILQGQQASFEIKGIVRSSDQNSPLYIDVSVGEYQEEKTLERKLLVLVADVTEMMVLRQSLVQRASEAELLLSSLTVSKDYIDKILRAMGDALFVTTASGKIKTVNQSAQKLFGYQESELLGQSISLIISDQDFLNETQEQSLASEDFLENVEVSCKSKTNQAMTVEFSCAAVQSETTGLQDFVFVGRDVTERKQAEIAVRQALQRERELNEIKSSFYSMVSHEFRNPMTTILTGVELIENYRNRASEQKLKTYFQRIKQAAKNITHLVEDVLVIGKAEAGKLEFQPSLLDLDAFCQDLVEELQLTTPQHQQIIFVNKGNGIPAYMDENLLRHILVNLLSNAIKYSPEGSNVDFKLHCEFEEATFEIKDGGIGIPPDALQRLFESFYRATNVGKIAGTGLGLAIVKKVVDLHQGKIEVASEVGVGTTFTVVIPLDNRQIEQLEAGVE